MSYAQQFAGLRLVRKIASGGMGEVWEACQTGPRNFEKRLAVKKILPHLTKNEEFINMFLDEGRLVAHLDHPNICQIFRMGSSEGVYYMEMEFVEGTVLTELIDKASRRGIFLPIEHCCLVALGLCAGLDYAHKCVDNSGAPLEIVHRDVSPPNVMLTTGGYIKLLDFGIAKAKSHLQMTQPGLLKGKLGYVSPEQVEGWKIDGRSDIFSVGILLWEMLTCRRLFFAQEELAVLHKISRGQYKTPSAFRENIPPELEWIVMKALARHPDDRFQTCHELEQALEDFLLHQGLPMGNRLLAQFSQRLLADLPVETAKIVPFGSLQATQTQPFSGTPESFETVVTLDAEGSRNNPKRSKFRVLIADDDEDIRDAVSIILRSGGYIVEEARDGQEAVEKITEKPFDVCMLDLDMPRLDGRGALEKIREFQPSLPCIIQTGNNSFQMATEMGRRGAVTYLLKPARRKAVLTAVREALQHHLSGSVFEPIWLHDFPTLLAEIRVRYRELPERLDAAKSKHAMLAAQFRLFSSWIGVLSLSCYRQDGSFSPKTNQLFLESSGTFYPGVWLTLFREVGLAYEQANRNFLFHTLRNLFVQSSWGDDVGVQAVQNIFETIAPLLSEPIPLSGEDAWDAVMILSQYHSEMWRHDVVLDDTEVVHRVDAIENFLTLIFERSYRMIDFNLVRINGLSMSDDGFLHDLTVFRGAVVESQTSLHREALEVGSFYIFDLMQRPWVKLSPLLISSPCATKTCSHSSVAFPVQFDPSEDIFYRCLSCGLLKRPNAFSQRATEQLFKELRAC